MRRYWVNLENLSNEFIIFEGDVFHHIFDVCRQTLGSQFEILGKNNSALLVEVTEIQKKRATAKIISERLLPTLPLPLLSVNLAIPKIPVLESTIERCVELGVYEVNLMISDFSFIKKSSELSASRLERLHKIILSATQQSGRGQLMKLNSPLSFLTRLEMNIKESPQSPRLLAYEKHEPSSLKNQISSLHLNRSHKIELYIGSEGGFSDKEALLAQNHGLHVVSLGSQVLRVETACLSLVVSLKYELGLF